MRVWSMKVHMGTLTMSDWPDTFFDTLNQWDFGRLGASDYVPDIQKELVGLIEPAKNGRLPFILPRLYLTGDHSFYVVAGELQQLGELREILQAYFGNTYFEFFHQIHTSAEDPLEAKLLEKYAAGFLRLKVRPAFNQDNTKLATLMRTLGKMLSRYHEKPLFITAAKRPAGRILRDFFTAINRADGSAGLEYVAELSAGQLLTPLNLMSLEFEALAASSRWDEILEDKQRLTDAITGVTSRNVTLVILQALRCTGLQCEVMNTKTCAEIDTQYSHIQSLFFKPPDISSNRTEEWMAWSIGAGVFGYDQLQHVLPKNLVDSGWWQRLSDWLAGGPPQPSSQVLLAVSLDELLIMAPSEESAASLIKYSVDASDTENLKICSALRSFPAGIVNETVKNKKFYSLLWDALNEVGNEPTINNWRDVFNTITEGTTIANVQQKLSNCLPDWGSEKWEVGPLDKFIEEGDSSVLRDILPQLLPWLVERGIVLSKVHLIGVLENLAADETVSAEDLNISGDVFSLLSDLPLTPDEYREALDCVDIVWSKVKSRATINYYLDVIDLIVDAPCADLKRREFLWSDFQEFLIRRWAKLDEPQQLTALVLAEELTGTREQFPSIYSEETPLQVAPKVDLAGKTLAIYSLTEGAGKRAAAILGEKYPGLAVSVNHDKSATSALINLAEKMNFFVFASRSAAHQAFYAVTAKRKDFIYPAGKGSTSIIRAFEARLLSLA